MMTKKWGVNMMITVNNREIHVPADLKTVSDFKDYYELAGKKAMIEHNQVALHPGEYSETMLAEGDQLQIVRFVGGG